MASEHGKKLPPPYHSVQESPQTMQQPAQPLQSSVAASDSQISPVPAQNIEYQSLATIQQPQQPQIIYVAVPQHQLAQHQAFLQANTQPQSVYKTTTPLALLNRYPSPTDCPCCGQRAITHISYVIGNTTHGWACGFFWMTGFFCWLPYLIDGFKNVEHRCGACGILLATWHRSGSVEVHRFL